MKRNRLYTVLGIACAAGYSWLFFSLERQQSHSADVTSCLFKNITGLPCPSCGATRALILLGKGEVVSSLLLNPIGLILAIIMVTVPFWLAYDLAMKKQTLFDAYRKAEKIIGIRWVAALLIGLVAANWIWNIYKNL